MVSIEPVLLQSVGDLFHQPAGFYVGHDLFGSASWF